MCKNNKLDFSFGKSFLSNTIGFFCFGYKNTKFKSLYGYESYIFVLCVTIFLDIQKFLTIVCRFKKAHTYFNDSAVILLLCQEKHIFMSRKRSFVLKN